MILPTQAVNIIAESKDELFERALKQISVQAFDALLTCGVRNLNGLLQLTSEDMRKDGLAAKYGLTHLSNYILYNFKDYPVDFYDRLKINLDLNVELGLQIFSFPMRYVDLKNKNRLTSTPGNIGKHWNVKFLRAIQCVLIRTRGLVGTKRDYFLKAFGKDHEEFYKILLMPEHYIIHRFDHEGDGSTDLWWSQVCSLSDWERDIFDKIVCNQLFRTINHAELPRAVRTVLCHYMVEQPSQAFPPAFLQQKVLLESDRNETGYCNV